jgi:hypothetical protein
MVLWALSFVCFLYGIGLFMKDRSGLNPGSQLANQRKSLLKVARSLQEIEEILMTGLVPSAETWNSLRYLSEPWATLSTESLQGLRSCGGSMLPTLKRLRNLAEDQAESLTMARAKSSQAFAQTFVCMSLVPLLGFALYLLLPAIQNQLRSWFIANGIALLLAAVGVYWLLSLTDQARWGGISIKRRSWILSAQCAGERFLALVRSGTPPDLAWARMGQLLSKEEPELADAWKYSIWDAAVFKTSYGLMENSLVLAGDSIKKAVQVSLMEGRPCLERVETALLTLRTEIRSHVERELTLLGTRALKPLFICVAPGLLCLLAFGFWLTLQETGTVNLQGDLNVF